MYDTLPEAVQKLQGTVVAYDGEPFCITECYTPLTAIFLKGHICGTKTPVTVEHPINDPKLCFHNLGGRLGYSNVEYKDYNQAAWVRRTPVRKAQQTQGLSGYNTRISRLASNKTLGLVGLRLDFDIFRGLSCFKDMFLKKYPSLGEVGNRLEKTEVTSQAFSRYLAIKRNPVGVYLLVYKDQDIGWSSNLSMFHVPRQFRYLDELLIEDNGLSIQ